MGTEVTGSLRVQLMERLQTHVEAKHLKDFEIFVHQYLASVSDEEIEESNLNALLGVILEQWHALQVRKPGEIKLKIFNPKQEMHQFTSPHTIIVLTLDEKPFLVRSLVLALNRLDINIHLMLHTGNLYVQRDLSGRLVSLKKPVETVTEAAISIEIDRHLEEGPMLKQIESTVRATLKDVDLVVEDFDAMMRRMQTIVGQMHENIPPVLKKEVEESKAFIQWLLEDHFIFLGSAEYQVQPAGSFSLVPESIQGLMRNSEFLKEAGFLEDMPSAQRLLKEHTQLFISKTAVRSTVNRGSHCDCISIKHYRHGTLTSETRFVGLFTSSAYHASPELVPVLRQKIATVLEAAGFGARSHDGKALLHILETFPRDEMYPISERELLRISMGVLQLQERQRTRLFVYKDPFQCYILAMVYLPRDVYHTDLRIKMQAILQREFSGLSVNFKPNFSKSVLCRIDYMITIDPHYPSDYNDDKEIERMLVLAARDWQDDLRETLMEAHQEQTGLALFHRYARAFPSSYREAFISSIAVDDMAHIEKALMSNHLQMCFYRLLEEPEDRIRFKLFQSHKGIALTDVLPILENMGLRVIEERPYEISLPEGKVWISDFGMQMGACFVALDSVSARFQETFSKAWLGEVENDAFNQLVIRVGLSWREIVLVRALAKYLLQIGFHYSQQHIADTLGQYPAITKALVDLFYVRFDISAQVLDRVAEAARMQEEIEALLGDVANLEQDRIIRRYLDVLRAMIRTNYFQKEVGGGVKSYVSFKFLSKLIPDLPKPVPMVEVFVYSPRVEGIHLRNAAVARGGLRWSDRREDFRIEVLGLVKAQQVKNAVIVPLGAKGGFFPKQLPVSGSRDAILQEGIECYRIFIRGLLDITDNYIDGVIVPPPSVLRYDGDDPYLVVAADKGTASFSDYANQMALEYDFWLGDAFASGGSNGYDHKKMAITARGAWESVKRHFLELDINIQKQDFTVIGIGDMAGDVFGNGMLRSPHIRLLGAFNHAHIFIDPNPNAALSFVERERLFSLSRSTWKDYQPDLVSQGGGVFERSAKRIPVSPEMKACFGIHEDHIEPNSLIKILLKSPVDLLWNGGIGTYIKASSENNIDVGDRTNDALRINANELRVKVVGEGGNLGLTQQARVEFALNGGMICTDAIDNSAGVDCSDHEVNIKILLNEAIRRNDLALEDRNALLATMQEEVGALVLHNNYHQTQTISHVMTYGTQALEMYIQLIRDLEVSGQLERELEFIPSNKILRARRAAGQGITAPEFSVLMAYTKTAIKKQLLASHLPDEPYFVKYLKAEFPRVLSERYLDAMLAHGLRREIIVTQLSNDVVTYMGLTFFHRMQSETGAQAGRICKALVVAWELLDLPAVWKEIESLDGKVSPVIQRSMMDDIARLARRYCRWILRNQHTDFQVDEMIKNLKPTIVELIKRSGDYLDGQSKQQKRHAASQYHRKGVSKPFAERIVNFTVLSPLMDITAFSKKYQVNPLEFAEIYYLCNEALGLSWLRKTLSKSRDDGDSWSLLLGSTLRDSLDYEQARIVMGMLQLNERVGKSAKSRVDAWHKAFHTLSDRWISLLNDIQATEYDYVRLSVMVKTLEDTASAVLNGHQE